MLRTIIWLIYFFLSTIFSSLSLIAVSFLRILGNQSQQEKLVYQTTKIWARSLVVLGGGKVEVEGADLVPQDGPVLFVCNHQGYFDIPLLIAYVPRPKGFIAKVQLEHLPIITLWMRRMHSLFLDRSNMRQSLLTMRQAILVLKEGHSLVIFPEGTRSKGGNLAEFKRGSLSIAQKAEVPIVPVTIIDSYKMLEGNKHFRITSAKIRILISAPVYASDLQPQQDMATYVRSKIQDNLNNN